MVAQITQNANLLKNNRPVYVFCRRRLSFSVPVINCKPLLFVVPRFIEYT